MIHIDKNSIKFPEDRFITRIMGNVFMKKDNGLYYMDPKELEKYNDLHKSVEKIT